MQAQIAQKISEMEAKAGMAGEKKGFIKPLMEHRIIGDLGRLSNDKSGFRDWKVRFKNAIASVFMTSRIGTILDWLEDPNRTLTGSEDSDELLAMAMSDGITVTQEEWNRWGYDMITLLTQKSDDKSEAFLVTKRSKSGWMAWRLINKFYSAISGLGMSSRMQRLMRPDPAKKDEEVIYEVENGWMN